MAMRAAVMRVQGPPEVLKVRTAAHGPKWITCPHNALECILGEFGRLKEATLRTQMRGVWSKPSLSVPSPACGLQSFCGSSSFPYPSPPPATLYSARNRQRHIAALAPPLTCILIFHRPFAHHPFVTDPLCHPPPRVVPGQSYQPLSTTPAPPSLKPLSSPPLTNPFAHHQPSHDAPHASPLTHHPASQPRSSHCPPRLHHPVSPANVQRTLPLHSPSQG